MNRDSSLAEPQDEPLEVARGRSWGNLVAAAARRALAGFGALPDTALPLATLAAVLIALGAVFYYAPREALMGDVQRIFYFHVASAWIGFLGFTVTFAAGLVYLLREDARWDVLAQSSGEVGLTFIAMTVATGALWARPVWGVYWTWEPRLTISAVQLTIYLAYAMLRGMVDDARRAARLAAVYGIAAFATVPLSWFAIRWWRTIHPEILGSGVGMSLTPRMLHTLLVSLAAFSLLYATLLRARCRLERATRRAARLRARLDTSDHWPGGPYDR